MAFNEVMAKIRYMDNKMAKWMLRHFYILFFEIFLVFIFFLLFVNTLKVIDVFSAATHGSVVEKLLLTISFSCLLLVLLFIMNSFWMLFVFNSILRMRSLMREMNFNILKRRKA